jgi:hypothetical protein
MLYTATVQLNDVGVGPSSTRAQDRRLLPNLALAVASLAAAGGLLGVLELGARTLWDHESAGSADGIYSGHVYSQRLGWKPRPGARFAVQGAATTINAQGYRGALWPSTPAAGQVRVLLLGDSVAFGFGVADGQTFADLLDPRRFETVNLAVPGYGVDQSVLRYELVGARFRPHVVVLNLCLDNDFADIMLPVFLYDGQHPKPYFTLQDGSLRLHDERLRLGPAARVRRWLDQRSLLFRLATPARSGPPAPSEHWSRRRRQALERRADVLDLMTALVSRLRERVGRDGARLVVAFHPNRASYRSGSTWEQELRSRPELQGVQTLSLAAVYRQRAVGFGRIALDGIGHLNPRGHRLAADALHAALISWPAS